MFVNNKAARQASNMNMYSTINDSTMMELPPRHFLGRANNPVLYVQRYVDTSSYLLAFLQLSERASERRSVVARLWIRLHRIPGSWLDPATAPPVGGDAGFNAFLFLVEGG